MSCEICKIMFKSYDDHHIHSTSLGGLNCASNRCRICPNCHRSTHNGEIIIEGRFSTGIGNIIVWRKKGEPSITEMPDPPVWLFEDMNIKKDDDFQKWLKKYIRGQN